MKTSYLYYFGISCAVVTLMTSSESVLAGNDNDLVNRIVDHWREQQGQVRSVRYVVAGEALIPKGRYNDILPLPPTMPKRDVPEKDYRYNIRLSWTIDFENNRMRKEYSGQTFHAGKETFASEEWIHIFDGLTTKRYFPPEMNEGKGSEDADLGVVNHGNTVETGSYDDPVFFAHGFIPSVRHTINEVGTIPLLDTRSLQLVNRASLGGTECVILKVMPPKDSSELHNELWVDQGEGGRILRKDLWAGRVLLSRVDVDYKGVSPAKWVATEFSQDRITLEQRFTVKEIEKNPPLDPTLFDIKLKPGMRLRKVDANNTSDDKEYLVGNDGKTLIEWDKRAKQPRSLVSFVFASIVIIGVTFSALWAFRRWKSRKRIVPACDDRTAPDTHDPQEQ